MSCPVTNTQQTHPQFGSIFLKYKRQKCTDLKKKKKAKTQHNTGHQNQTGKSPCCSWGLVGLRKVWNHILAGQGCLAPIFGMPKRDHTKISTASERVSEWATGDLSHGALWTSTHFFSNLGRWGGLTVKKFKNKIIIIIKPCTLWIQAFGGLTPRLPTYKAISDTSKASRYEGILPRDCTKCSAAVLHTKDGTLQKLLDNQTLNWTNSLL